LPVWSLSVIHDSIYSVLQTEEFETWLEGLRDRRARTAILKRILQIEGGLLGDVRPLGDRVSEARIHYGPGYRLYYTIRGTVLLILLCGGDKGSQKRDIARAKRMALELGEDLE
jgi:putative addiction module killer protein